MSNGKSTRVSNAELSVKLDYVCDKVDDIHKCVYGNSNPERGLAFRVTDAEKFIGGQKRLIWIIVTASVGSMVASIFALIQLLIHSGVTP